MTLPASAAATLPSVAISAVTQTPATPLAGAITSDATNVTYAVSAQPACAHAQQTRPRSCAYCGLAHVCTCPPQHPPCHSPSRARLQIALAVTGLPAEDMIVKPSQCTLLNNMTGATYPWSGTLNFRCAYLISDLDNNSTRVPAALNTFRINTAAGGARLRRALASARMAAGVLEHHSLLACSLAFALLTPAPKPPLPPPARSLQRHREPQPHRGV